MILTKGKHSFWSQLLLSMIAIFALPQVYGLPTQTSIPNETHQRTQAIPQNLSKQNLLVKQIILNDPQNAQSLKQQKTLFVSVFFYALSVPNTPPIRAGPLV